jgi:diguanylate cyclase (GGDEF)-like protein
MTGPPRRRSGDAADAELARRFAVALATNDDAAARRVTDDALDAGLDVAAIQSRIIAPAMREIGRAWQEATLSVGQEHLATAISQEVLGRLFAHALHAPPCSRERVLLAGVEAEQHVLGLRMVADVLEGAGFDVHYRGADVRRASLVEACEALRPAVVGLSATMALHVPALSRQIEAVRALPAPPAVVVGGRAVTSSIAVALGAPRVESSEEVVGVLEAALRRRRVSLGRRPPRAAGPPSACTAAGTARAVDTPGRMRPHRIETDGQAFADYATSAADAARDAARHAFSMEQLAYHDQLTGLWNRRAYDDRLRDAAPVGRRLGMVLMVDVDQFKQLNDAFGHEAGDATLRDLAQVLLGAVRAGDVVARYGGDEFALLLPGARPDEAVAIAERIREAVAGTADAPSVSVSIGGAPVFGDRRRTMLAVDKALYTAKRSGRNRVAIRRRVSRVTSGKHR